MPGRALVVAGGAPDMLKSSALPSIDALSVSQLEDVLDHLRDVAFFLQAPDQRFIGANRAMLDLCGVERREQFLGRRAGDFFDNDTSKRFEDLHHEVMRARKPARHRLEKVTSRSSRGVWLLSGRWPVLRESGELIGVAGIARLMVASEKKDSSYRRLSEAAATLQANPAGRLNVVDLARSYGGSVSQLERDFCAVFGVSPRRLHSQMRLEMAVDLLSGQQSIAEIAYACGYKDQSAFSRQFSSVFGISPSAFRSERKMARQEESALCN